MNAHNLLGFISMPGTTEWIVIGVVALLIFGRRLPEVARSLGKGIVEFKKGLQDVESEVDKAGSNTSYSSSSSTYEQPYHEGSESRPSSSENPASSDEATSSEPSAPAESAGTTAAIEPAHRDDPPRTD